MVGNVNVARVKAPPADFINVDTIIEQLMNNNARMDDLLWVEGYFVAIAKILMMV